MQNHAADRADDVDPQLQQPVAQPRHLAAGARSTRRPQSQFLHEHVGRGGQEDAQLVRREQTAARAVDLQPIEGGFELVDSTIPDTTPPSLVGAEVAVSGAEMALAFDEELAGVDSLHGLLASALSVTADGEPVPVDGYAYGGFGRIGRRLQLFLSSVITRGQTVVVSYADPTPGDDDVALQDLAGNDLASFTAPATNNSAVEPVPALPLTGAGLLGLLLILLGSRRRPSG